MLSYLTVPVTAFQQNCSLIWDEQTRQAAVIDPGGDLEELLAQVERLDLKLEQIWLTHAHIDHAGGTGELASRLGLPGLRRGQSRFRHGGNQRLRPNADQPPTHPLESAS